jgi:hypothetical protein
MRIRIFFNGLLALLLTVADSTAVHAQSLSGQGTWENTLQAGDVGSLGTTNDLCDSALGPTWLRDPSVTGKRIVLCRLCHLNQDAYGKIRLYDCVISR